MTQNVTRMIDNKIACLNKASMAEHFTAEGCCRACDEAMRISAKIWILVAKPGLIDCWRGHCRCLYQPACWSRSVSQPQFERRILHALKSKFLSPKQKILQSYLR
jgi:hypothetical protein